MLYNCGLHLISRVPKYFSKSLLHKFITSVAQSTLCQTKVTTEYCAWQRVNNLKIYIAAPFSANSSLRDAYCTSQNHVDHSNTNQTQREKQLNLIVNELSKAISEVSHEKIFSITQLLMNARVSLVNVKTLFLHMRKELIMEPVEKWNEYISTLTLYGIKGNGLFEILMMCRFSLITNTFASFSETYAVLQQAGLSLNDIGKIIPKLPSLIGETKHLQTRCKDLMRYFPKSAIKTLVLSTPNVLADDWEDIESRLDYVHYKMGLDSEDIVGTSFFAKSIFDLQCRHQFLFRAGKYITPKKSLPKPPTNPSLKFIVDTSDTRFVTKIAGLSIEEYTSFQKILKLELEIAGDTIFLSNSNTVLTSLDGYENNESDESDDESNELKSNNDVKNSRTEKLS